MRSACFPKRVFVCLLANLVIQLESEAQRFLLYRWPNIVCRPLPSPFIYMTIYSTGHFSPTSWQRNRSPMTSSSMRCNYNVPANHKRAEGNTRLICSLKTWWWWELAIRVVGARRCTQRGPGMKWLRIHSRAAGGEFLVDHARNILTNAFIGVALFLHP